MEFRDPLIGSRAANYKFFYCTGGSVLLSLMLLTILTGYTSFVSTHVGHIMDDITFVVNDVKEILPDAKQALKLLKGLCNNANFTKGWGSLCE